MIPNLLQVQEEPDHVQGELKLPHDLVSLHHDLVSHDHLHCQHHCLVPIDNILDVQHCLLPIHRCFPRTDDPLENGRSIEEEQRNQF